MLGREIERQRPAPRGSCRHARHETMSRPRCRSLRRSIAGCTRRRERGEAFAAGRRLVRRRQPEAVPSSPRRAWRSSLYLTPCQSPKCCSISSGVELGAGDRMGPSNPGAHERRRRLVGAAQGLATHTASRGNRRGEPGDSAVSRHRTGNRSGRSSSPGSFAHRRVARPTTSAVTTPMPPPRAASRSRRPARRRPARRRCGRRSDGAQIGGRPAPPRTSAASARAGTQRPERRQARSPRDAGHRDDGARRVVAGHRAEPVGARRRRNASRRQQRRATACAAISASTAWSASPVSADRGGAQRRR